MLINMCMCIGVFPLHIHVSRSGDVDIMSPKIRSTRLVFLSYYDRLFFPAVICNYHFAEVRCLDAASMCSYGVVVHKLIIGLINFLFSLIVCVYMQFTHINEPI